MESVINGNIFFINTDQCFTIFFLRREKGPDDKGKQKKKTKEKKTTKLKTKEGEDDGGGWTEVKGSSLSAAVCHCILCIHDCECFLTSQLSCTMYVSCNLSLRYTGTGKSFTTSAADSKKYCTIIIIEIYFQFCLLHSMLHNTK